MAYKIIYEDEKPRVRSGWGRGLMTLGFFALFLALVSQLWPEGQAILKKLLIPGDPEVTMEAAHVFAQELGCGYSLGDAAYNFCRTVLQRGYSG